MRIYSFGDPKKPVILLLPGTCCHWENNFGEVIPLLEKSFYVNAVSFDGFDETEDTVFPTMLEETEKLESYIKKHFGGKICCAYGCSLSGSFVGLLIQRRNIQIDHGIIGSSDLDQSGKFTAGLKARIMSPILRKMLTKGKLPSWMQKWIDSRSHEEQVYLKKMLTLFGIGSTKMAFVKSKSIYNQFYSDLVTPLEDNIGVPGTTIHCFYAEKMGEKYLGRYKKHFSNPDIRHHNLQHEELLVCYPEKWVSEVEACCGIK